MHHLSRIECSCWNPKLLPDKIFRDLKTPLHLQRSCSQTQDPSTSLLCKLIEVCSRYDKSGLACRATQANNPTTDLSCDFSASFASSVFLTPVLYEIGSIFSAVDLQVTLMLPSSPLCDFSSTKSELSFWNLWIFNLERFLYLLHELFLSWLAWEQNVIHMCSHHDFDVSIFAVCKQCWTLRVLSHPNVHNSSLQL